MLKWINLHLVVQGQYLYNMKIDDLERILNLSEICISDRNKILECNPHFSRFGHSAGLHAMQTLQGKTLDKISNFVKKSENPDTKLLKYIESLRIK